MKKLIFLIFAMSFILVITAACGNGGTTEATDEVRTITWMTRRSTGWEFMEELLAEYHALNPNFRIILERSPDIATFEQQLTIRAAAGELPELFDIEVGLLHEELAAAGALVNIDDFFAEIGYDRMLAIGLSHSRLPNGNLHVIAWENNIEWIWYRPAMFQQAGIERTPETFDELLAVARQLDAAGIVPVAQFPVWHATRWLSMIPFRLTGNEFLNQLLVGEVSMSDPVGLQAAEWFQEFAAYFQPGWATGNYGSALEAFLGGHAAMYFIGSWEFGSFLDENGELLDEFGFFAIPTLPGAVTGRYDTVAHSGLGTAINAELFDDELRDFIIWLLEHYPLRAFQSGVLPAMTFDLEQADVSDFFREVIRHSDNLEVGLRPWDVPMHSAAVLVLFSELENLGMGLITPEEFARRVDEAIVANLP